MEEIIKQNKNQTHEEFQKLLSEDLGNRRFKEGEITTGIVEEIGKKFVFIDLGLKSSGAIPLEEFKLTKEIDKIEIGSKIDVLLERIENKNGEIVGILVISMVDFKHISGITTLESINSFSAFIGDAKVPISQLLLLISFASLDIESGFIMGISPCKLIIKSSSFLSCLIYAS